jgi:chromate transporter
MDDTTTRMGPPVSRSPGWEIVRVFLTLGALSPSGPGLTGVLQTEVQEKRGWLSQARFVEGMALVNMLPGPSGAQLSIFLGYIRAGWWGGLLAGCCFLVPSFVIMLTLTLLYTHYGALPGLRGVFQGLNPVVVGIFAVAVSRLSRAAITDVAQGGLALAGALALWVTPVGIVPLLLLAGALGVVLYGSRPWGLVATTVVAALQGVLLWRPAWLPLPVLPAWASSADVSPHAPSLGQIGFFFVKVGLFTFGGGLVLLAFLQDQIVQHLQWLSPQAFLDGLALGRLTPGPIPMLAAFIGYHVAGLRGAVVAGVAIFVPSFVLMLSLLPMLEHLERVAWLHAARQGISPAIIGMIAVALLKVLPTAISGLLPGGLALATVGAMVKWRVGPVPLMAVGAAIGAIGLLWGPG